VAADLAQYATVEKLFAFIRKTWAARPSDPEPGDLMRFPIGFRIDVQYDQARGFPTRVCVDPSIVLDDEFGFLITDFKVLSSAELHPRMLPSAISAVIASQQAMLLAAISFLQQAQVRHVGPFSLGTRPTSSSRPSRPCGCGSVSPRAPAHVRKR
jgi:hypothetical protein